jgi:hypothetical protein
MILVLKELAIWDIADLFFSFYESRMLRIRPWFEDEFSKQIKQRNGKSENQMW